MKVLFRTSFVAVLLAGVVLGGVGSSGRVLAGQVSVKVGGVCVREGARDTVAGKPVVCVLNVKKQLRWRVVTAKNVKVVTGTTTTSTSVVSTTTVAPTTTSTSTTSTSTTSTTSTSSTSTTSSSTSSSTSTTSSTTTSTSTSVLAGDRMAPVVTLARSAGSSGVAKLTFTVTGNEPISCSTLSASEGVDFVFTRISLITSIVQTTEDVCTISAQSTAEPGDTNPRASSLTAAASFSITDTAGNAQTVLTGSPQTIWVLRIARPVIALSATTETANLNVAITGYTVTSSGGTVASYSLTGTLPAGLSFSTTTGRITGTPTAAQAATTYTITATNTSGSATATFTLTTLVYTCANGFGTCALGETGPGGGIVFYVEAGGGTFTCGPTLASTCKYLEVAPNTWSGGAADPTIIWQAAPSFGAIPSPGSAGQAVGSGYRNSATVVAWLGNDSTHANGAARRYSANGLTDWYLPARDELNQLCVYFSNVATVTDNTAETWSGSGRCNGNAATGRAGIGGFVAAEYHSSSDLAATVANSFRQNFATGGIPYIRDVRRDGVLRVRPIRAFG